MANKGSVAGFVAKDLIIYILRTEDSHQGLGAGLVANRPDHLLPEARRWPPKGQPQVLQQRDQITYPLKAGNGHQKVSSRFCSKETRSLTA